LRREHTRLKEKLQKKQGVAKPAKEKDSDSDDSEVFYFFLLHVLYYQGDTVQDLPMDIGKAK
jgi:hypothetical protein